MSSEDALAVLRATIAYGGDHDEDVLRAAREWFRCEVAEAERYVDAEPLALAGRSISVTTQDEADPSLGGWTVSSSLDPALIPIDLDFNSGLGDIIREASGLTDDEKAAMLSVTPTGYLGTVRDLIQKVARAVGVPAELVNMGAGETGGDESSVPPTEKRPATAPACTCPWRDLSLHGCPRMRGEVACFGEDGA